MKTEVKFMSRYGNPPCNDYLVGGRRVRVLDTGETTATDSERAALYAFWVDEHESFVKWLEGFDLGRVTTLPQVASGCADVEIEDRLKAFTPPFVVEKKPGFRCPNCDGAVSVVRSWPGAECANKTCGWHAGMSDDQILEATMGGAK